MKGLKALTAAILAAILTLALVSCTTSRIERENEITLNFPVFPDPIGDDGKTIPVLIPFDKTGKKFYSIVLYNESGEVVCSERLFNDYVLIPFWYWKKVTDYVIYVDEAQSIYEAYKKDFDPG